MPSLYAEFDRKQLPVVIVNFTGEKAQKENFELYLAELSKLYDPQEELAILFDATNATFPGLKYQKAQAKWMKENEKTIQTYCKAIAYVVPNASIRLALRLIFSLQNNPVPFKVFKSPSDAQDWLQYRLNI